MLEVIGVGFGRTGTLSLKHALETLGFGKCYHFREMVKAGHAKRWLRVADGESQGWESVFRGYRATTDWPAAACYRELANAYPDAKLILTVRDASDWYDSVTDTILRLRNAMPARWPVFRSIAAVADRFVWEGEFHGRADDREYAIARYNEHIADVQGFAASERLLVFTVNDGWEPLCRFLGVPVPANKPFPRVNDRRVMRRYVRLLTFARVALPAILAAALLALAALIFLSTR